MLTFEDCLALCDLTQEEIDAIAEHEHLPEMAALEYGNYLINTPDGELAIKTMILEDIEYSRKNGNYHHAKALESVLEHFVMTHPKLKTVLQSEIR